MERAIPDAFRGRKGLSKGCWRVYQLIENGVIHRAEDCVAAGMNLHTARLCLTKLKDARLIEKVAGIWGKTKVTVTDVAKVRGTYGYGEKQAKQHVYERACFAAGVEAESWQAERVRRKKAWEAEERLLRMAPLTESVQ